MTCPCCTAKQAIIEELSAALAIERAETRRLREQVDGWWRRSPLVNTTTKTVAIRFDRHVERLP